MSKTRRFRDSITGLFTSKKHADANPSTTQAITQKPLGRALTAAEHAEAMRGARIASADVLASMSRQHLQINKRFADNHLMGDDLRVTVSVTIERSRE